MMRVGIRAGVAGLMLAALAASTAVPVLAQGIIPGRSQPEDLQGTELSSLGKMTPQEVATVQRLLVRLGFLPEQNLNRTLDAATVSAISNHLRTAGLAGKSVTKDGLLRSLFGTVWRNEGWSSGTVRGQDIIIDKEEVSQAQDALKQLSSAPGPVDGIFGPATLAAVEGFQGDSGMKVTGLLTRNTFSNIMRAVKFVSAPPTTTLHVLGGPGYVDSAALDKFETDTKTRVIYETYDNSSETKKLLMEGSPQYDLMIQAGAQMRQVLEKENSVVKIDRLKIPNTLRLDTASQSYTEAMDPLNAHTIPYLWGTVGLGVNLDKVLALLPNAPLNSMALVLDPANAQVLSQCGIAMIDEPIDVIPSIVSYVGGDFRNVGMTDLEQVDATLSAIAPYVQVVSADAFVDGMIKGKYCASIGYSGDVLYARERAREKAGERIVYNVPKEGSELWFQLFVIPQNARNVDAAHTLIDFMIKPEVAASNTKALMYANTVWGSGPLMDVKLLEDPALYPPRETMSRLTIQPPIAAEVESELTRIWAKLKKK